MSFVIMRRRSDGRAEYVNDPGSKKAFTPFKCRARRYLTMAEADADRCVENEVVRTL